MKVLALEPYYGGSHQAFLDGWSAHSRHEWKVLGLPSYDWKWRMRHGAVSLADRTGTEHVDVAADILFCSDMLDLAAFLGIARRWIGLLPAVIYFHENQLTYPVRRTDQRDLHFAVTNLTSASAADAVWFNSAFHRDEFFEGAEALVRQLPKGLPDDTIARIREKTVIEPPGIEPVACRGVRADGPLRILWAARWEYDKRPEDLFSALGMLDDRGINFRISVVGEQYRDVPAVFRQAEKRFADRIDCWGYQSSRSAYFDCLRESDVVVSTAVHEFFGLSVVEAIAAGAIPLLPRRLAYPEILAPLGDSAERFFYDGTPEDLAARLEVFAGFLGEGRLPEPVPLDVVERYFWKQRAAQMDSRLEEMAWQAEGRRRP